MIFEFRDGFIKVVNNNYLSVTFNLQLAQKVKESLFMGSIIDLNEDSHKIMVTVESL